MEEFDLGIIGAGPAGYTAALHGAATGKKVVLFEKNEIGGVCLNKGCIPTKAILHVSEVYNRIKNCSDYGISVSDVNFDYSVVLERKNKIIEKLRKGIELALKNSKVSTVKSEAEILSEHEILSDNTVYSCKKIICAAGSSPKIIKGLEFDDEFLLSSDDILNLDTLPKSILIAGSGAIGLEWTRIMSNFGVETVLIELAPHLLPAADIEVSKRIERILKSKNIKYYTNTSIQKIEGKTVTLSNNEVLNPEIVLVAAGRTPCIPDKKFDGVSYIGDMAGEIQLAHYAIKQAVEAVDFTPFNKNLTPFVIYGTPEIAWAGKREQDLEAGTYQKSLTLISSLGKAHCDNETEGFIKILVQNNKIIGTHIVSSEASSILQQLLIAMQFGIGPDKLKEVCFPHPTYSEGIFEGLYKLK